MQTQSKLIYNDSQTLLASLALAGEPVRIGRGASCQLRVSDPTVADEHCCIGKEGALWMVESLSGAATYVNGQEHPITKQPLRDRDLIRCGALWIQFILCEAAAQTDAGAESRDATRDATRDGAPELRQTAERLEAELATYRRDLSLAQSELAQATAKLTAANQEATEQEAATAKLLNENRSLVREMEHLRTILNHKDQVIAEAREAPQSMMAELVAVRRQCDELTEQRKRLEVERDAAQLELSRRVLTLSQAEEELRRLRHQSEQHERLLGLSHDAGNELAKAVQKNSTLVIELNQTREKLARLREQLAVCLNEVSVIVTELGVKVYALRAAVARQGLTGGPESAAAIGAAIDQILGHLNESDVQLQILRKMTEVDRAETQPQIIQAAS